MKDKQMAGGRKRKSQKFYFIIVTHTLAYVLGAGLSAVGFQKYQTHSGLYDRDLSLAQAGMQHLHKAERFLRTLSENPLDDQNVSQARHEFATSSAAFVRVNNDLNRLPWIGTSIPVYRTRLSVALHTLPIANEASQTGISGCDVLSLIIPRLHNTLFNVQARGVAMTYFTSIEADFQQIKAALMLIVNRVNHVQLSELQLDPRPAEYFATFQKDRPQLLDYLRVYVPLGSVLHMLNGWQPRGTNEVFGREVWAGFFTLT